MSLYIENGIVYSGDKILGKKKKKNIVGRNKGGIISKDYRKGGMVINTTNNKRNR